MKKTNADKGYERLRELAEGIAFHSRLSDESINKLYGVSKKELCENAMKEMQKVLSNI